MFKLPVHALILFCASRWVIPSVLIPSMVRTTSPIPTCAWAALPPSLSWNSTRMVNEKLGWSMFILNTSHNILFTMLFHRKEKKKLSFFLCESCENCCNTYSFLIHFNDRKVLHSIAYFSKSNSTSTLLTGSYGHSRRDTSRDRHSVSCTPSSSHVSLHTWNFSHKRKEKGCKPAFSILDFPLKNLLKVHLFANDRSCAGKTLLIVKLTSPKLQLLESQKFNITDRPVAGHCFVFPSVGLQAPMTCSIFRSE